MHTYRLKKLPRDHRLPHAETYTLEQVVDLETCSLEQASDVLKVSPRSLADKRFRLRLNLSARKVGRKVVFIKADLLRILERGKEHLPGERRQ